MEEECSLPKADVFVAVMRLPSGSELSPYIIPHSSDDASAHEHDLAGHASLTEQLMRASCLGKGNSLRD